MSLNRKGNSPTRHNDSEHKPSYPASNQASAPLLHIYWLNVIGCLLALPFFIFALRSPYPMTFDELGNIILAEYNRYANGQRRARAISNIQPHVDRTTMAANGPTPHKDEHKFIKSMAAIVGYREDPLLYKKCLRSYITARGCAFVLACVDGDEDKDMEMVEVFNEVYLVFPDDSIVLRVLEPLGEVATEFYENRMEEFRKRGLNPQPEMCRRLAIQHCCNIAREMLSQYNIRSSTQQKISRLCIYQRHLHKKGIMFTSFIFSIVICEILGIEYLWSSDSDSYVFPDSLNLTVATIAGDPTIGGASSGLMIHNTEETIVTRLGSAFYWFEMYLTRSGPASLGFSDCQSGPCATFRVKILADILLPWYNQTVLGRRMIINEDRHLTTNVILRGWKIAYASDVIAATETPTTLARWVGQQVRWARGAHIESFQQPAIYSMSSPLFFWTALKREVAPIFVFVAVSKYLVTSKPMVSLSVVDMAGRVILGFAYNCLKNPDGNYQNGRIWALPGFIFYHVPLPAIQLWGLVTMLDKGWGTSARGEKADPNALSRRLYDNGFMVVWMGIVGAALGKWFVDGVGIETMSSIIPIPASSFIFLAAMSMAAIFWYILIDIPPRDSKVKVTVMET